MVDFVVTTAIARYVFYIFLKNKNRKLKIQNLFFCQQQNTRKTKKKTKKLGHMIRQ